MISSRSEIIPENYSCNEVHANGYPVHPAEISRPQGQVLFLELHKLLAESTHSQVEKC